MGALTHNGEVLQSLPANASQINFDKTGTNLNSTQTENAIKEVNTKANTLQSEKADTDIVASDFSTAVSYTAGNYCIYEGKFYKFKTSHSGAWSAADVDEIKIAGELSSLMSGLTHLESGTVTLTDVPAGTNDFLSVTFDRAYTTPPSVMATLNADGTLSGASCAVRTITTTSAIIYARNGGSADATLKVDWVAIGI